jgi:HEAT repeat protein
LNINQDFNSFTEEEKERVLKAVRELLETGKDIRVVGIRRGSVKMQLELSPEEAERLLWAIKAGALEHLNVVDASYVNTDNRESNGGLTERTAGSAPSVVSLLRALESEDASVRRRAIRTLGRMGEKAKAASDLLERLSLEDPDSEVRRRAIRVLVANRGFSAPHLRRLLRDPEDAVALTAVETIGDNWEVASNVLPELIELMERSPFQISNTLRCFGIKIVPQIIEAARGATVPVRAQLIELIAEIGYDSGESGTEPIINFLMELLDPENSNASDAIRTLGLLGSKASVAVPKLIGLFEYDGFAVASALTQIGAPAVPALVELLHESDSRLRWAVYTLCSIGPAASAAVPRLIELLGTVDEERTWDLVATLGAIGEAAVSPLLSAARDPVLSKRKAAIQALGRISPLPEEALSYLISVARDNRDELQKVAVGSLGWVGSRESSRVPMIVPVLAELISTDDSALFFQIVDAIGQCGAQAGATAGALVDRLASSPNARQIVQALANIGSEAVPPLLEALKRRDTAGRADVVDAINRIRPNDPAVVSEIVAGLIDCLASRDITLRLQATEGLGIFATGKIVTDQIWLGLLHDEYSGIRLRALNWIGEKCSASESAALAISKLLNDADVWVRRRAVQVLGNFGANASAVVPELMRVLEDAQQAHRAEVVETLRKIGAGAREAVPLLGRELSNPDTGMRWRAAEALGRIGPAAENAIPELLTAIQDDELAVQLRAVEALGRIGAKAKIVIPELRKLQNRAGKLLRKYLTAAIRAIEEHHD